MRPPPVHCALTVDVPEKRLSVAMTLAPAVPEDPMVADHEIIVCVTSWDCHAPARVQRVWGLTGSLTSASTVALEPCMTARAS